MMDHPNIAKVLDAGETDNGRPYFVMELVKGVPITEYCDEHHLTPKERLELFLPVLHAVQHAHQKGIIHRDLKPSNVLVAEYDHQAVPKVIDFGVAKATNQRLTDKTMFTQYGQLVGTFEYMSPEQAKLNQMDIRLSPEDRHAWMAKAWLLSTSTDDSHRDGKQAIEAATKACELTFWKDEDALAHLAAAYAESGDFAKAVHWQTKAIEYAPPAKRPKLESHLKLFSDNKPVRESIVE